MFEFAFRLPLVFTAPIPVMRWFLCFCGLFLILWLGVGHFRARGETPWTRLENGLETRLVSWRDVKVRAFRGGAVRVEVASGATLDARDWLVKKNARVAINGGYFDAHGKPLGLRVNRGHKTSSLRRADWGVFWVEAGRARIRHTRDFSSKIRAQEAIQCGPRLVVDGVATDLKPQWDRRSGIGIDGRGRVVLAISDGPLSLADWASVFASSQGLGCRDALNLDGGGSTQIAYSTPRFKGKLLGSWPVPDAIVMR